MSARMFFQILAILVAIMVPSFAQAFRGPMCPGFTCTTRSGFPTLTGGNHIYQNPEIIISFWQGSNEWTLSTQNPTRSQYVGATLALTNGPYFSQLNQYANNTGDGNNTGTIGLARMAPYAPIYTGTPPGSAANASPLGGFGNQDIKNVINDEIKNGTIPAPVTGITTVYVVFVPNGYRFCGSGTNGPCATGAGNTNGSNSVGFDNNGIGYYSAWVSSYKVLSHELAEAITAYEGVGLTGCTNPNAGTTQIGDYCQCYQENQLGFAVQPYWSNQDTSNQCVIPETWGTLYQNDGPGGLFVWYANPGNFPVRQLYAGSGGVIATDTTDNSYLLKNNQYTQLSNYQSVMYAVGSPGGLAGAIGTDAQFMGYMSLSHLGVWTGIYAPNNDVATSVYIARSGSTDVLVATDKHGYPWYYQNGSWARFGGGYVDQLGIIGGNVVALMPDHQSSWVTNDFTNWSLLGGPASQILANNCVSSNDSQWGSISTNTTQSLYLNGINQNAQGYMFQVLGGRQQTAAIGLQNKRQGISFLPQPGGSWQLTGPLGSYSASGRMVSCQSAFATGCSDGTGNKCVNY